ncbi:MAG: hypothetical protein P8Y23_16920 [Candidatus Lokiarchaeota archaeon]|jgi:hypothetical protein
MKDIETYWNELIKIITHINMTLSDEEEVDLLAQFNDEEEYLFKMILQQIDEINDFNNILNVKNEAQIKKLISSLLENQGFIKKINAILLKQSLK